MAIEWLCAYLSTPDCSCFISLVRFVLPDVRGKVLKRLRGGPFGARNAASEIGMEK
jgi:hypothetical protein